MSFELTTLGEYAKVQGGFAYKGDDFKSTGSCPVLKIKNVRFGYVDYSEAAYIANALANETEEWSTKEGDILISMTGSGPNAPQSLVGRVARIWRKEPKAWINQRVGRIILKEDKSIHPDFLFYLLSSPRSQEYLVSNSSGSANQANISGKIIESLPCPNVIFEESSAIAKILRELDEKILINRQINQTLEHIAQAIFKSWFVDFDPVKAKIQAKQNGQDPERAAMRTISGKTDEQIDQLNKEQLKQLTATAALFPDEFEDSELGEIPKGWDVTNLGSVTTELRRGISPKYIEEGGIQVINQKCIRNHTVDFTFCKRNDPDKKNIDGRELQIGDVLVNSTGVGTLGRLAPVRFLPEITVADSHVTVVRGNNGEMMPAFLTSFMLSKEEFIESSGAGSTGQTELNRQVLAEIMLCKPIINIQTVFEKIINPTHKLIAKDEQQIISLSEIRDSLLPKLLSGEIPVGDTQLVAEEMA